MCSVSRASLREANTGIVANKPTSAICKALMSDICLWLKNGLMLAPLAERTIKGEIEPNAARVAADIIKWQLSKQKPKSYGDKVDMNLDGNR